MTLFGRTLDGQEIASLVAMLLVLAMWIAIWRRDRQASDWFRTWNADRKARRDAEIAAEKGESAPPATGRGEPRGPWD